MLSILLCLLAPLAAAQDRSFDSAGVRIRYVDYGSGAAVLLIHGFTADLERSWVETGILPDLARDHRVIAFDLRGHGGSDKPHEPRAYDEVALDAIRLLDHLAIDKAHVVGYSLGGIIAAKLLTTYPQRFASALLAGAAYRRSRSERSDREADAAAIEPTVTWGINPGQSVSIGESIPGDADEEALAFMGFSRGARVRGTKIDVAFIGSCTNGRLSDLREAARIVKGKQVARHVKALVVPGSVRVARAAEREGLDEVFRAAGFEWRNAGCSMCLGMNPDFLLPGERCASTSNRNFEGRQGPGGRTHLVSPEMAAAAAIQGHFVDIRNWRRN